jgi:hypothetical protein
MHYVDIFSLMIVHYNDVKGTITKDMICTYSTLQEAYSVMSPKACAEKRVRSRALKTFFVQRRGPIT